MAGQRKAQGDTDDPGRGTTKQRIREAAAELFSRQGYAGTGLKQVSTRAHAPFGSIYHFFPGGKDELAEDMIRTAGPQFMRMVLDQLDQHPDPAESLELAFTSAAESMVASDYANGCPVATLALDVADTNEPLRRATSEVFDEWLEGGTTWFARHLDDRDRARELAYALVMITEGAFMLSRISRESAALYAAGTTMAALMRSALTATPDVSSGS